MYACPNCGAGLKFHITSQDLFCEHCDSHYDPYKITKDKDGVPAAWYETTVYTCPYCGGEIVSEDEEAAAFCSYCGGSTVLTARLEQLEKPARIIPFQITKEGCKEAYAKKMRRAFFSPKAIRSEECIESFRGIYMPYWMYHVKSDEKIRIDGTETYVSGSYTVTDYYHVSGHMETEYPDIPFDASEPFSDRLSSAILPYDMSALRTFTPSMLSGFYADRANVEKEAYQEEALQSAREETIRRLEGDPELQEMTLDVPEEEDFSLDVVDCSCALLPVWFFSYRDGDRVSYAAVNGQTGKVFADTPIDPKRYSAASLLLALPIFLLLNLFLTLRPQTVLNLAALFLLFSAFLFRKNVRELENRLQNMRMKVKREKEEDKKSVLARIGTILITVLAFLVIGLYPLIFAYAFLDYLAPLAVLVYLIIWVRPLRKQQSALGTKAIAVSAGAAICMLLLSIARPAADLFYYGGVVLCMAAVLFMIYTLIQSYNLLSTQPLPQFNRTGGDDRA
ncbi:MAG: hypothetical protein Q4B09_08095 [Lachnospiraceae bacterium]|nr:hypothetical protein [Lachnospiraceae bacterium]